MPRESALNFPKSIQSYNVLHHIHYFHCPSSLKYFLCLLQYRGNSLLCKYSCCGYSSGVGGYINCPWPPPPTHLTNICTMDQKSLRKTANMGHTGTSRQLLKNRPSAEGRDPIRERQHWLEDMTWEKLGSFGHYSLFNTDLHPAGSNPLLREMCPPLP